VIKWLGVWFIRDISIIGHIVFTGIVWIWQSTTCSFLFYTLYWFQWHISFNLGFFCGFRF
jgi:hypothetical protein